MAKLKRAYIAFIAFALISLMTLGKAGFAAATEKNALIELHEDNWKLMLTGEWMVEFFAPWCPACKNLAPTWEKFASSAIHNNIKVAKIDVTTSPSLSGRFFVTALPTIYHVKNGEFRQYRGPRDGDTLAHFIKLKQWQSIEPISSWKKPDTVHMSLISYFFKLSHVLKDFNARLQEEYGLPTWGSYALFAIGTIFVGAALGLVLVCLVDFLYPAKKTQRQSFSEARAAAMDGVEDIANDEIEDDALVDQEDESDAEDGDETGDGDGEGGDETGDGDGEGDGNGNGEGDTDGAGDATTSDGEKYSNSENENDEEVNDDGVTAVKDTQNTSQDKKQKLVAGSSSGGDVRKRKPRKAD